MKGRNSVTISIRVADSVHAMLVQLADKRGVTVSAYVKQKVEDYVARVDKTINNPVSKE